jgi:hypothetical protein
VAPEARLALFFTRVSPRGPQGCLERAEGVISGCVLADVERLVRATAIQVHTGVLGDEPDRRAKGKALVVA